jgi:serine/threonine-protein kinase
MNPTPDKETRHLQPIRGYEILERIGSGGMGTIYKAKQVSMNRIVALKVVKKQDLKDPLPLDRLRREALLIARMDHPHIVKGIDMGETNRYYFFTMEFIDGQSVKELLDLYGPMEEHRAASVVRDVARALFYAHQQKLTHRDVKPGNILINPSGQTKLTDLGLAKGERDLTITREGMTVGTPQYISPEQAKNPASVDIRSDIYSLGATFYHMVTGRMPFEGDTLAEVLTKVLFGRPPLPESIRPGLSAATSRVISRMMAKNPKHRYSDPGELLDDLDVLLEALKDGSKELASLIGMNWKDSQRGRFSRYRLALLTTGIVMILAIPALLYFFRNGDGVVERALTKPSGIIALQADYDAGKYLPAHALRRIASLPPDREPAKVNTLRERILEDVRRIMEELLRPGSPRYDRALGEAGFRGALARLDRIVSKDVVQALGGEPTDFPPELKTFWKEKRSEADAHLIKRIDEERVWLLDQALECLDRHTLEIEENIDLGAYKEAWEEIKGLKRGGETLLVPGVNRLKDRLGVKGDRTGVFKDPDLLEKLFPRLNEEASAAEKRLRDTIQKAQEVFIEGVKGQALVLLGQADLDFLNKGVEHLLDQAVQNLDGDAPEVPDDLGMDLRGLESLRDSLETLLKERESRVQGDLKMTFHEALIKAIDTHLQGGDYEEALRQIDQVSNDPSGEKEFLDRWEQMIQKLQAVEPSAFEALSQFVGLNITMSTRSIVYEGELRRVDPGARMLWIRLAGGQDVQLNFDDLKVIEVLDWASKIRLLDPGCKGLYAFYRQDNESAASFFQQAEDFKEAVLYLERIRDQKLQEDLDRRRTEMRLQLLLEEVQSALDRGDWQNGFELLSEVKNEYRAAPGWSESRLLREALEEKLEAMRRNGEMSKRIEKLFSVPTSILSNGGVRVEYSFTYADELKDFSFHGQCWKIQEGALECGSQPMGEPLDFYHKNVGLRFGEAFDIKRPIRLLFLYRPPVEGSGPCFMGISFFGGCFGIRSFPNEERQGQVNFWMGDLNDYQDYFFIPNLGELRPKRGKTQPFGFERGEEYRIELLWSGKGELILRIDNKDIYRERNLKLTGSGFEIKTLKQARIESMTLEGGIRGE